MKISTINCLEKSNRSILFIYACQVIKIPFYWTLERKSSIYVKPCENKPKICVISDDIRIKLTASIEFFGRILRNKIRQRSKILHVDSKCDVLSIGDERAMNHLNTQKKCCCEVLFTIFTLLRWKNFEPWGLVRWIQIKQWACNALHQPCSMQLPYFEEWFLNLRNLRLFVVAVDDNATDIPFPHPIEDSDGST